jgi:ketosteroid isomerase-like protein
MPGVSRKPNLGAKFLKLSDEEVGMRRLRCLIPCMVAIVLISNVGALKGQSRDEKAVRAIIDRLVQANNSVDEKVARQVLADLDGNGGPFFLPFTAAVDSASGLEPMVTQLLSQLSARTFSITGPLAVHVDKNLGWAAFSWRAEFTFKDGTHDSLEGRTTAAFSRDGKVWKVSHWHSSMPGSFPLTKTALDAEAQAIIQVERNAWDAVKNKQLDKMEDYFADDSSMFVADQAYRVSGKPQIMSNLKGWLSSSDLRSYQLLDPQVRVFGNTALLTYYFSEAGVSGGKDFSEAGKFSVVFVKRDGKWRAVHEHESTNH